MRFSAQPKSTPAYTLYRLYWTAVDWLYPPRCAGCQRFGVRWCPECAAASTRIGQDICPICGNLDSGPEICPRCKASPPPFDAIRSWGVHAGPLREAIHQLKYAKNIALGDSLAPMLVDVLKYSQWQIDLVCPVPLSFNRLKERGYNQSAELARPLALALGLSYKPAALRKVRETRPQVGLNASERALNIEGAFTADPGLVNSRSVLVIDDVATTGSTLSACAVAARRAGAKHVFGLTLTRPALITDDKPSQGA